MSKHPYGSISSYVIGFILSLEFTIIPYYLVTTHRTVPGTTLLTTILVLGVLQMIIQVVFFLHLGRGPKPLYNVAFFVATVGMILVVTVGSIFIMSNLHSRMSPAAVTQKLSQDEAIGQIGGVRTGACQEIGASHIVTITNGAVDVPLTEAHLCDTLTFVNKDSQKRDISFGPHPHHESYGGESEVVVTSGRSETITLNQAGTFIFHDHLDPDMNGRFTVTP